MQHSYVDYTWLGEAQLLVRHPINDKVGVFAHGVGQAFTVNELVAQRGTQLGGLIASFGGMIVGSLVFREIPRPAPT